MTDRTKIAILVVQVALLGVLLLMVVRLHRLRLEVDRVGKGTDEAYANMTVLREDMEDMETRLSAFEDPDGGAWRRDFEAWGRTLDAQIRADEVRGR